MINLKGSRDMEFLTVEEVQHILRIGKNSAYDLCKKSDIPCVKIGGSYRIPKDEFHKWLEQQIYKKEN